MAFTCDNNSVTFAKRRLSSFTYFVISCGHSNLWSTKFIQNTSSNMNSHSEEEDRSDAKSLKQRENPRSLQLLTSTALVRSRATLTVFLNNNRKIPKKKLCLCQNHVLMLIYHAKIKTCQCIEFGSTKHDHVVFQFRVLKAL